MTIEHPTNEARGTSTDVAFTLNELRTRNSTLDYARNLVRVLDPAGVSSNVTDYTNHPEVSSLRRRFRELRNLGEGWHHEGKGESVDSDANKRFVDELAKVVKKRTKERPRLYPTLDGRLIAEWTISGVEISAELLPDNSVDLFAYCLATDTNHETTCSLSQTYSNINEFLDLALSSN